MTVTVRYRGPSDRRIITTDEFAAAGLGGTTAVWEKANGFEIDFDDITGAWLLSQGEFESGDPNQTFAGLLQGAVKTLHHDWNSDGWDPFTEILVSASGSATSQYHVVTPGRGRITGHVPNADGNRRTWMLRDNTSWENSEICSLWWGGSVFDSTVATPQMGHVHRAVEVSPGVWRAFVVTNNIFLSQPNLVNQNIWQTDGAALTLGSNGGNKSFDLDRSLNVTAVARVSFGGWINQHIVTPAHLYGLATGDIVDVTSLDATFTESDIAVTAVALGVVSFTETTTEETVAKKVDAGTITPEQTKGKRFWPYWVRSRLIDEVLYVKVWRYMEPEPDWGSTTNVKVFDTSLVPPASDDGVGGTPAPNIAAIPSGPGLCGLVGAHLKTAAYLEYGETSFTQL